METRIYCKIHNKEVVSLCFEENCPSKLACNSCLAISSCNQSIFIQDIETENIFEILNSPKFKGNLDFSKLSALQSIIAAQNPIERIEAKFTFLIDEIVAELNKIKEDYILRFKNQLNKEEIASSLFELTGLKDFKKAVNQDNSELLLGKIDKSPLKTDFKQILKQISANLAEHEAIIQPEICLNNMENIAEKAVKHISQLFTDTVAVNQVKELHSPKMAVVLPEKSQKVFSNWLSPKDGHIYVSEVLKPNTGIYSLKMRVSKASMDSNISFGVNCSFVFNSEWSRSSFLETSAHITGKKEFYWESVVLTSKRLRFHCFSAC